MQDDSFTNGLFFIVGTGRCGSTLLQAMLACHPRLFVTPETKFFSFFDPAEYVGDPLASRAALQEHLAKCNENVYWRDLKLDEARLIAETEANGLTCRALFVAILRQFHERGGKRRLGEKTPGHFKSIDRIRTLFPDARFIHICRDPRDFVASMLRLGWGGHASPLLHAKTWLKVLERDQRHAAQLGEHYLRLRYEDLLDDPERELRRICVFLGETYDPAMLEYTKREQAGFGESEMAWKGMTLEPLSRAGLGRYRGQLTGREIRMIERVAGPQMQRLGYERDPTVRDQFWWSAADMLARCRWWLTRQARSVGKRFNRRDPYARMISSASASKDST